MIDHRIKDFLGREYIIRDIKEIMFLNDGADILKVAAGSTMQLPHRIPTIVIRMIGGMDDILCGMGLDVLRASINEAMEIPDVRKQFERWHDSDGTRWYRIEAEVTP